SLSVNLASDVAVNLVDGFMIEVGEQFVVSNMVVGVDLTAELHALADELVQGLGSAIRNDVSANLPLFAVNRTNHDGLGFVLESGTLHLVNPLAPYFVHVANLAANESLIGFDRVATTTELATAAVFHGEANPVQHEPCRLLSDADSSGDLVARYTVLA